MLLNWRQTKGGNMTLAGYIRLVMKMARLLMTICSDFIPKDSNGNVIPNLDSQWYRGYELAQTVLNESIDRFRMEEIEERNRHQNVSEDRRS